MRYNVENEHGIRNKKNQVYLFIYLFIYFICLFNTRANFDEVRIKQSHYKVKSWLSPF